jgi:hypothetical protein
MLVTDGLLTPTAFNSVTGITAENGELPDNGGDKIVVAGEFIPNQEFSLAFGFGGGVSALGDKIGKGYEPLAVAAPRGDVSTPNADGDLVFYSPPGPLGTQSITLVAWTTLAFLPTGETLDFVKRSFPTRLFSLRSNVGPGPRAVGPSSIHDED